MRKLILPTLLAIVVVFSSLSPAGARAPIVISDSGLSRENIAVQLGGSVGWSNELDRDVTIVSGPLAYWDVDVSMGTTASETMTLAGFWNYSLADDPAVVGRVRVPPQVSDATPKVGEWFTFIGATQGLRPGYKWDILRKKVGTGYLGTVVGGITGPSVFLRFRQTGEFVFAIRTFGYNPSVGYDTYTPISPRITVTVTE